MRREFGITLESTPFLLFALLVSATSVLLLATPYYYLSWAPAAAILFFLIFSSKPQAFFYVLIFLVPFDAFTRLNAAVPFLTLPKIVGLSLTIFVALFIVLARKNFSLPSAQLPVLLSLFLLATVISAILSPYPATAFNDTRQLLVAYAVIFLSLFFITEEKHFRTLSIVLSVSLLISACLAIFGFFSQSPFFAVSIKSEQAFRATGGTSHPNHFAATVIFGIPLLAYWSFNAHRPRWKILSAFAFLALVLSAALSFSRAGFVVMFLTLALVAFANIKRLRAKTMWIPMFMVLALGFFLVVKPPVSYIERITSLTQKTDSSIGSRFAYLQVALDSFAKNPLFGTGPGTFPHVFGESTYAQDLKVPGEMNHERRAHNTYMEVLAGSGLVALVLFGSIIILTMRNFFEARRLFAEAGRKDLAALAGSFALSLSSLLIYFFFLSRAHHRYFWLAVAVSYSIRVLAQKLPPARESDASFR